MPSTYQVTVVLLCLLEVFGAQSSTPLTMTPPLGASAPQVTAPTGPPGPQGPTGPPGADGEVGPKGNTGSPGATGQKGERGTPGAPGAVGPTGATGVNGTIGERGVMGVTGFAGELGVIGVTGEPGMIGATGATGPVGAPGALGAEGDTGDRGSPGVVGSPGEVGAQGDQGSVGILGDFGFQGEKGAVGPRGYSLMELDIDECANAGANTCNPTSTTCVNRATSYKCECKAGYEAIDGTFDRCKDVDECLTDNGDCAGACVNTEGSFTCTCPSGTQLTANNQCSDQDECVVADICEANANTYCVNSYRSYSCVTSQAIEEELTTVRAPVAQALTVSLITNGWMVALIIWLAVLTFLSIVVLFWLIHILLKLKREKDQRQQLANSLYNNGGMEVISDDEDAVAEGMAGSGAIHIDIPHLPRSQRGTMKGKPVGSLKGNKSYKSGSRSSRPASVSSSTGSELKTASVRQHRVATGERNAANRLSGVDTFY